VLVPAGGPVYAAPPPGRAAALQQLLRGTHGISTTVRAEKGVDISGACGQLVVASAATAAGGGCKSGGGALADIEELAVR
jgi:adenine C2-methylase RlmN of 23S rRNA A2503 and tRNA A37